MKCKCFIICPLITVLPQAVNNVVNKSEVQKPVNILRMSDPESLLCCLPWTGIGKEHLRERNAGIYKNRIRRKMHKREIIPVKEHSGISCTVEETDLIHRLAVVAGIGIKRRVFIGYPVPVKEGKKSVERGAYLFGIVV